MAGGRLSIRHTHHLVELQALELPMSYLTQAQSLQLKQGQVHLQTIWSRAT